MEFLHQHRKAIWTSLGQVLVGAFAAFVLLNIVFHEVPMLRIGMFVLGFGTFIAFPQHLKVNLDKGRFEKLSDQLRDIICRDTLTNVATRHFFFERMEMTPGACGLVLMVDIDHFKRINDTHGHPVGDAAIRTVAHTLTRLCRGQDIVCRFGGEEFVIFIYDVDAETGLGMAEILRECVAGTKVILKDLSFHVTVSIGGAMKADGDDIDMVIGAADEALYVAKESGRNRCVMASATGEPDTKDAA